MSFLGDPDLYSCALGLDIYHYEWKQIKQIKSCTKCKRE